MILKYLTIDNLALSYENMKVAEYLVKKGALVDLALPFFCKVGLTNEVNWLLDQGANIETESITFPENIASFTPLMIASIYGRYHIAELLVKRGADVWKRNTNLWTAFDLAQLNDWPRISRMLRDAMISY